MIKLPVILSGLYADRNSQEITEWLEKYNFLDPLKKSISQLNRVIAHESLLKQACDCVPVGHIASNLLWAINDRIHKEKNPDLVQEMENLVSDVCFNLLKEFFQYIKSDKKAIVAQIDIALKDCCEFHNYDYSQLVRLLRIEQGISYFQTLQHGDRIVSAEIPHYCWKGKPTEFAEFLNLFTEHKLVKSKKGLAKLFENPSEPLNVSFDPALANLTLQFFYVCKKRKFLSHTVCGYYQVLEFHIPDFKKTFLKNMTGGDRVDSLRNSKTQWSHNQERIDKWLNTFTPVENRIPTRSSA